MSTSTATALVTHCPHCGADTHLRLYLDNDCDLLHCKECDEDIALDELRQRVEAYTRLIRVCEAAGAAMRSTS